MKTIKTLGWAAVLIGGLTGHSLVAAELGMDAPELGVSKFIKGKPIKLADGKGEQVYVVEFWATWCGPCRTSIPHLSELQKKFKDKGVTIIGISDETESKVRPFVDDMGDKMNYTVAIDNNRNTYGKYMTAFEQGGIPTAFVVDQAGKIVWVGHPMAELEQVLGKVVEGKFDVAAHKAEQEKKEILRQSYIQYLDATVKGEPSAAVKLIGFDFVEDCENPDLLNQFAWTILTHSRVTFRDIGLALKSSKKAYVLTGGKDPSVTDTYARALYKSDKRSEAIKYQKEALSLVTDPRQKSPMESALKRYESGR